jgi:hypothetical protein
MLKTRSVRKFLKLVMAVIHREPRGHICDLWMELAGRAILCGKPPNQYLMLKKYIRQREKWQQRLGNRTANYDSSEMGSPMLDESDRKTSINSGKQS